MFDLVLIQPPVTKRILTEDPRVLSYFEAMDLVGSLLGDSPLEPNYGLLTVAQVARQDGWDVAVLDWNFLELRLRREGRLLTDDEIREQLQLYPARIYGVSYMTVTYGLWARRLSNLINEVAPEAIQIAGGIHPTMCADEVLRDCPLIDYVFAGEAERTIISLVRATVNRQPVPNVPGIRGRDGRGAPLVLLDNDELESVPYPAYDLITQENPDFMPRIYSSRGCAEKCNFCVVSDFFSATGNSKGRYYRDFAPTAFESHLRQMLQNFAPKVFCLGDLTFAHDRPWALWVCQKIRDVQEELGTNAIWWAQTRADLIDNELATAMYLAGCRQIAIGIEGGTDTQRKRVIKRLNNSTVKASLTLLRDSGFEIQTYWIIGLPRDTRESVQETIGYMEECLTSSLTHLTHISVLVPYPGTILHRCPQRLGIELTADRSADYAQYWMNCDPFGCGEPVYSTVDRQDRIQLCPDEIYELWLQALGVAEQHYRTRHGGPAISRRPDPRLAGQDHRYTTRASI